MDCVVHGVSKSWTRLSDFHFTLILSVVKLTHLEPPSFEDSVFLRTAFWGKKREERESQQVSGSFLE